LLIYHLMVGLWFQYPCCTAGGELRGRADLDICSKLAHQKKKQQPHQPWVGII